jgi:predicted DNA-binding transcriptional regulator AlpA
MKIPEVYLSPASTADALNINSVTLKALMQSPSFPAPIKHHDGSLVWLASDIANLIEDGFANAFSSQPMGEAA